MSKITIANRKFLEEQVKTYLKEIGPQDVGAGSALSKDDGEINKISTTIANKILELPAWYVRASDKLLYSGGDKAMQALFNSDAPREIKYFFSVYETNLATELILTSLNKDNFIVSQDLTKTLNKTSTMKDPKKIYDTLKDFYSPGLFGMGDVSENVLVSEDSAKQIIETGKKKNISTEQITKLFFKRPFNLQYKFDPYLNEILEPEQDILEFLDTDLIVMFNYLNKEYKEDFGAYYLYSRLDPTLTKDIEDWKKAYRNVVAKSTDVPFNLGTFVLQFGAGEKLENLISKHILKIRDTAEDVIGVAVKHGWKATLAHAGIVILATAALNKFFNVANDMFGTGLWDRMGIVEAVKNAKAAAYKIGKQKNYEFTTEDVEKIKNILIQPINIVIDEFQSAYDQDLLSMTAEELTNNFVLFNDSLNILKQQIFGDWKNINNKQDFDEFIKAIDAYQKSITDAYNEARKDVNLFEQTSGGVAIPNPSQTQSQLQIASKLLNKNPKAAKALAAKFKALQKTGQLDPKYNKTTGMIEWAIDYILTGQGSDPALDAILKPILEPVKAVIDPITKFAGIEQDKTKSPSGDLTFRGIKVLNSELKASGLTEDFVSELVSWYDLSSSGLRGDNLSLTLEKLKDLKSILEKIDYNSAILGRYNQLFTKKWEAFGEPLSNTSEYDGKKTGVKPTFVRSDYYNFGLLAILSGRGSMFSTKERYQLICAPLVWFLEQNSCLSLEPMSETSQQFKDLADRSLDASKGSRFDKLIDKLNTNRKIISLLATEQDTKKAIQNLESFKGSRNLATILEINFVTIKLIRDSLYGLAKAENEAEAKIKQIDNSVTKNSSQEQIMQAVKNVREASGPIFMYLGRFNRIEMFFSQNNIRFFL